MLLITMPLDMLVQSIDGEVPERRARDRRRGCATPAATWSASASSSRPVDEVLDVFPRGQLPVLPRHVSLELFARRRAGPTTHYSLLAEISHSEFKPVDATTIVEETIQRTREHAHDLEREDRKDIVDTHLIERDYTYPTPSLERDDALATVHPWLESQGHLLARPVRRVAVRGRQHGPLSGAGRRMGQPGRAGRRRERADVAGKARMLNATVTRALIPCGGKGTRMSEVTHGAPKELIDVAGEPLLVHVLRECAASGVAEVLIVTAPGKEEIERVVAPLAGAPGMPHRLTFVIQREPRGLADALRHGREFAEDQTVGVALPDNLFIDGPPALGQVIETHDSTGKSVVAIVEIAAGDAERRGPTAVYDGALVSDGEFRITRIPDKGAPAATFDTGGAATAHTGVGRYVFTADALAMIDESSGILPAGRELDDVPLMQRLLARDRLTGRLLRGRFLDAGLPAGYREANATLATSRLQ